MEVHVEHPALGVVKTLDAVMTQGDDTAPRGLLSREITDYTLFIKRPWEIPFELPGRPRALSASIAAYEAATLIAQTSVESHAPPPLMRFAENGQLYGAYGPRVRGQIRKVIDLLGEDPSTRQAVITIFDGSRDLGVHTKDMPCTVAIQFSIRGQRLNMRVMMRSNDAYLGLPYDLIQFGSLQSFIAQCIGYEPGTYTHTVGSMHVYETDFDNAYKTIGGWQDSSIRCMWEPPFYCLNDDYSIGVAFCLEALNGRPLEPHTRFESFVVSSLVVEP